MSHKGILIEEETEEKYVKFTSREQRKMIFKLFYYNLKIDFQTLLKNIDELRKDDLETREINRSLYIESLENERNNISKLL